MTRAISRDSFQELKNYLSVQFQQGRPILDADLNEAQAVALSLLRRLTTDTLGDGSPNSGFAIEALYPPPPELLLALATETGSTLSEPNNCFVDVLDLVGQLLFDKLLFFLTVPGNLLEDFESGGFTSSSPQGVPRVSRDRPYQGEGFLRLSGHPGTVTVSRLLDEPRDLSAFELATFRFRLNRQTPGTIRFFLEDDGGNRSVWTYGNPAFAADTWLAGVVAPLDIRFHIRTTTLPVAYLGNQGYSAYLSSYGGTTPLQWEILPEDGQPATLHIEPSLGVIELLNNLRENAGDGAGDGAGESGVESSNLAVVTFQPETTGTLGITVRVTDARGRSVERRLSITIREGQGDWLVPVYHAVAEEFGVVGTAQAPTGTPADLAAVRRYGFELYQNADEPLVWDLDDLRLGSTALREQIAENDFLIRGSDFDKLLRQMTLFSTLMDESGEPVDAFPEADVLLDLLNTELRVQQATFDTAGRFYLSGLPCVQVDDILYTDQADPNDPPLTPPPPGQRRRDVVYLDAWTEPVTYVQDPGIREVALGGPDTSTRDRVRHRVRVAQGGRTPTGDGTGSGTLTTEGSYTARANRLYLVEVDGAGDVGTATFRWSNENASVVARVIEPVPPGSTVVVVEDASAFHPGDLVLLRKEFGAERHQVHQVSHNEITLAGPTGDQLADLPGGDTPGFTTFALADRPMLQRWDGFGVPIVPDPDDETVSASIPLDDGVRIRFGGNAMLAGDHWTFTTRYLAGDEVAGIDADTRIERLDFARPRGVRHHYATLAVITRDGDSSEPGRIVQVEDRRMHAGGSATATGTLRSPGTFAGTAPVYLGGIRLPAGSPGSRLVAIWNGDLYLPASGSGVLSIIASFYNDEVTDPELEPGVGKIQDRERRIRLYRRPIGVTVPITQVFLSSGLGQDYVPPSLMIPTAVHFFAHHDSTEASTSIELDNMQVTVLELAKSRS